MKKKSIRAAKALAAELQEQRAALVGRDDRSESEEGGADKELGEDQVLLTVERALAVFQAMEFVDAEGCRDCKTRLLSLLEGRNSPEALGLYMKVVGATSQKAAQAREGLNPPHTGGDTNRNRFVERLDCPQWSGLPEELASWKREVVDFFRIHGIADEKVKMMTLKKPKMVPQDHYFLVKGVEDWDRYWAALEEYITPAAVRRPFSETCTTAKRPRDTLWRRCAAYTALSQSTAKTLRTTVMRQSTPASWQWR